MKALRTKRRAADIMFRENLKLLLAHRSMRARRICESTGLSPAFLSEFLNGKQSIGLRTAGKIADSLGVPLGDFLVEPNKFVSKLSEVQSGGMQ